MPRSNCIGKQEADCKPPECAFVKGPKRNYCRSKHNTLKAFPAFDAVEPTLAKEISRVNDAFSQLDLGTNQEPQIPMDEVDIDYIQLEDAAEPIQRAITKRVLEPNSKSLSKSRSRSQAETKKRVKPNSKSISELNPQSSATREDKTSSEVAKFRETYRQKRATRKISQFVRNNRSKIRAHFLKAICSDSGVCTAFGKETSVIQKHFDHFDNFRLLSANAIRIGEKSRNGFVNELTYEREGYRANAILKSSAEISADNLLYEALVGFFINSKMPFFPSFVETYGLYQYKTGKAYVEAKRLDSIPPELFQTGLTKVASKKADIADKKVLKHACNYPISLALLIQHIKDAPTIRKKCNEDAFVKNDLFYVLYQIYMTIAHLSNVFTHYDLHDENVLIYEPVKGSHIEYHYHFGENIRMFRSKYIAKIIDYGRCYFNDVGDESSVGNSRNFFRLLCETCTPECGFYAGFNWMDYNPEHPEHNHFICSLLANPSHDLRLLHMLSKITTTPFLKLAVYGQGVRFENRDYGTMPNRTSGLPDKFNNVIDAFKYMHFMVNHPDLRAQNEKDYQHSTKMGELHIYAGGKTPMRYVPA